MPLDVPNLDDRRWADLVEDARALIPRLAPRWTDHNVHDPGITFIELFAWLTEMEIYQLNRVGAKHREVFGRLAGVRRWPARPARVEILVSGVPTAGTTVPAETQLTPLEGDEIVFETTSAVVLTRSRLLRVIVDDVSGPVDRTAANEKIGIAFLAFGEHARAGAELRLGFDRLHPDERTLRLSFDVVTDDLGEPCGSDLPIPPDGDEGGAGAPPVTLAWECREPRGQWRALELVSDDTYGLTRSGAVTLSLPADAGQPPGPEWIRARIVRGDYDIEPRLRRVGVNGLPCEQRETVRDELLGRGNGRPDQEFALAKRPILLLDGEPPVIVEVEGEVWEAGSSFESAGPTTKQFVFDRDGHRVLFGNGLNGRVPMPGQVVRARLYRTSAGRAGNVAKDLTWKFKTAVVPGVSLGNPRPAVGGADPESLNDLELRARALLNRPQRAVTPDDIERLALGTPHVYVARAAAIPNCPAPERITVVAVPKVRPGRTGPPAPPSRPFLEAIESHLQRHRLLCDNLRVVEPVYVEVRVSARLRLAKGAGPTAVIERARRALDRFFAGDAVSSIAEASEAAGLPASPCPTRWPFGRSVFPSEVSAVLDGVRGVDAVSHLALSAKRGVAAIAPNANGVIVVPRIGLVFSGEHDLAVDAGTGRAR